MNLAIVIRLQGLILRALAAAFALCLGVAWLHRAAAGEAAARAAFGFCLILTLALAVACQVFGRAGGRTLFRREALAVIGLGWLLASLLGALPYLLTVPGMGLADAIFESASGFTTTGATVLADLDALPRSLLFWRALTQWVGGLGVVVFLVAILSFLGAGAKVLFARESSAQAADLDTSRVQQGVLRLIALYLGLSGACGLAYWLAGMTPYEAVTHLFTTVSTGGFSTRTGSMADFNSPLIEWLAVLFMALGGTAFPILLRLLRGDGRALWRSTEVRAYYAVLVWASLLVALVLKLDPRLAYGWGESLRAGTFQVVSIMTTTGYASADFDQWLPVTHFLLFALMLTGGCTGSTAGGAKVLRIVIALKVCAQQVEKAYRARVVRPLNVNGKYLRPEDQEAVLVFMVLLGVVLFSGTMLLAILEPGMSFEGSFSALAAALFNVGPGFAEVGPLRNYAGLLDASKLALAFFMILGRLEFFALLALFAPGMWRR
jgi:trk system potassium uptake protein TrkH